MRAKAFAAEREVASEMRLERLAELEIVVGQGLDTFIEVGTALMEIRDSRLYKELHPTFEEYCLERWGFTASRARQMIAAVKTVTDVTAQRAAGTDDGGRRSTACAGAAGGCDFTSCVGQVARRGWTGARTLAHRRGHRGRSGTRNRGCRGHGQSTAGVAEVSPETSRHYGGLQRCSRRCRCA